MKNQRKSYKIKEKKWINDTYISNLDYDINKDNDQNEDTYDDIIDTKLHTYLDKHHDYTRALLDVLLDWGDCHSTTLAKLLIPKEKGEEYREIADRLVEYGANLNHPKLIGSLYYKFRRNYDHMYYPTAEIEYLLDSGANPNMLLRNLWVHEPSYSIEQFHNNKCEVSVLVKAGARFIGCDYLCKYLHMPWESEFKMTIVMNPAKINLTRENINTCVNRIFAKDKNYYLIDFMINNGADPDMHNGSLLKFTINDYLYYTGCEVIPSATKLVRKTSSVYDEANISKLMVLSLVFMIKNCSFEHVVKVYTYIDTIIPVNFRGSITDNIDTIRNSVKILIDIIRPNAKHKVECAIRIIQRAWRTAISNPKYTLCINRLQKEYNNLLQ